MTPEGKVKQAIVKSLKEVGAYYFMPVQNGMGAPSLDFLVCHGGKFIGIEAKAPGKKPTPRQELTMRAMQESQGIVFVVDSTFEAARLKEKLLIIGGKNA